MGGVLPIMWGCTWLLLCPTPLILGMPPPWGFTLYRISWADFSNLAILFCGICFKHVRTFNCVVWDDIFKLVKTWVCVLGFMSQSSEPLLQSIWSELKLKCKERKCDVECSFSEMELVLGFYSGTSAGSFLVGIGSILFILVLTYAMHAEAKK